MGALRRKTQRTLEHMDKVWDRFVSLKVGDLEGDEVLYRDMVADYGIYFKGAMGAEAIQARLHTFDLNSGATMIVQCSLRPGFDRAAVERDVTRVLTTS